MRDSTKLLLLNHQIHRETQELIRLLPTKSYVMDVIIANEAKLWATWLYAPVLTTRVDQVYATIRSMGYPEPGRPIFQGNGGALLTYALYNLIERGVRVGPLGRRTSRNDEKISIKEIIIDVQSPDVSASEILPGKLCTDQESKQYRKKGPMLLRDSQYILCFVLRELEHVLRMSYASAEWGVLIYERIGKIKVLLDGELRKEWDLAKELATVKFDDSFGNHAREKRPEVFRRWKLNAYRTRVKMDLPVLRLKDDKKAAVGSSSA